MIPNEWMPNFYYSHDVKIILHWTASGYNPSELCLDSYHFLVDGNGEILKGYRNVGTPAPHTYGFNYEIGIGICCMGNDSHPGFNHGKYPMKKVQFDAAIDLISQLCKRYKIRHIAKDRILTHAEVTKTLGVDQWGKWDIAELSFKRNIQGAEVVGDYIRSLVVSKIDEETQVKEVIKFDGKDLLTTRTNSQTYVKFKDLESAKMVERISYDKDKKSIFYRNPDTAMSNHSTVFIISGDGYILLRDLEKVSYMIGWDASAKTATISKA